VTLPACKPIVCNHPTVDNGGLVTGDNVRYRSGEEAAVICDDGFELRNNQNKIVCQADGSWHSADAFDFPECKERPCGYPDETIPFVANGSLEINGNRMADPASLKAVKATSYRPGSVALYHCRSGFLLVPLSAGKMVCRQGRWEGSMPACGKILRI